ncbi:Retrovirus-related Pol poly, partial [Paramuricea clavata]
ACTSMPKKLQNIVQKPLDLQINSWNSISVKQQQHCIKKATEDCMLVCDVIAPNNGQQLFEAMVSSNPVKMEGETRVDDLVKTLMNAYKNASNRNTKTQILSLYAYKYSIGTLKKIHLPYEKLSSRQIHKARCHAKTLGPGTVPEKKKYHRVRVDMSKVDHFIEFINRPYFYQDVSYGSRILKLDNGETMEMPNVVRTVTRSTMISQYTQFCREENVEPLGRSTLFKILEVREASQRKSLQGLDNTAADGSAAFHTIEMIVDNLEKGGLAREWCVDVKGKLRDAKRYLKTGYRVHCKPEESTCPDHCRKFALSDENDSDYQEKCSHQHSEMCKDCCNLVDVLHDIECKIQSSVWNPYSDEQREDLQYDFKQARSHILQWKAHILRSINQEASDWFAKDIGQRVGIAVCRYDYSEPQYGKDVCDRILWPMKTCIRRYCNEGHDILCAESMRTALSERPVKGTSACVCEVDEEKETLQVKKIDGFGKLHNIQFEEKGIRVWKAYGIGRGKEISFEQLVSQSQGSTGLKIVNDFFAPEDTRAYKCKKPLPESSDDDSDSELDIFECSEPGCVKSFQTFSDLESHLDIGDHSVKDEQKQTLYDKLRRDWVERFTTAVNISEDEACPPTNTTNENESSLPNNGIQIGWALLKPRSGSSRFSKKVRSYLTARFDIGELTGHKADPQKVSADMRNARDEQNNRLFTREEWLTKTQIQGFFSRLAANRRKNKDVLDLEYKEVLREDEECERQALIAEIAEQIKRQHPISYDAFNLCEGVNATEEEQSKIVLYLV